VTDGVPAAIEVRGLVKRYGAVEAVRGLDLAVREGEVFALLGPNGAGKTTTVEILEGHRERTSGEVSVLGVDPARGGRAFRERIGIVLQQTGVEPYLTVRESLELTAGWYRRPRDSGELLDIVGLTERARVPVRRLSGGQRRRLDLALALCGDPKLLFLDEPTTGFDPAARHGAWDLVRRLRGSGLTVLLTTHFMDEAEQLADRVAVIVDGRIVAEGAPRDLIGTALRGTRIRFRASADLRVPLPAGLDARQDDGNVEIRSTEPTRDLHRLTAWALEHDVEVLDLDVRAASLEDAYLSLTQRSEGEGVATNASGSASA
jgi:ABC-2 type transport system ATP-binding protein